MAGTASAQTDAYVTFKAQPQQPMAFKVIGVSGANLMVKDQYGDKGLPLSQIQEVRMAEPPDVKAALQAFQAKDFAKALTLAKSVTDKYKGLPAGWAITMALMVGNVALEQKDLVKAEAAYKDFAAAYPGNSGADLGRARIAVAKKDYDAATRTAEPLCQKALTEKYVSATDGQTYGQAFLVMGQVKEAKGDYAGALEAYLRVVTLFYHDRGAVALAQERADDLRKQQLAFVP